MNAASEAALAAAREKFFSGLDLPEGLVPAPILRSWQRCAEQGLDAGSAILAEPMTAAELRALQEQNETLRLLSRSELVSLRAEAKLTDSVVILTDAKGLVLDTAGSPEFAGRAAQVALRPGVAWSETSTGTNAIETRPVSASEAERFTAPSISSNRMAFCTARPLPFSTPMASSPASSTCLVTPRPSTPMRWASSVSRWSRSSTVSSIAPLTR